MNYVILVGGMCVGMGVSAVVLAWCFAERTLWISSSSAPSSSAEGTDLNQPLLPNGQQSDRDPSDALEAQPIAASAATAGALADDVAASSSEKALEAKEEGDPGPPDAAASAQHQEGAGEEGESKEGGEEEGGDASVLHVRQKQGSNSSSGSGHSRGSGRSGGSGVRRSTGADGDVDGEEPRVGTASSATGAGDADTDELEEEPTI